MRALKMIAIVLTLLSVLQKANADQDGVILAGCESQIAPKLNHRSTQKVADLIYDEVITALLHQPFFRDDEANPQLALTKISIDELPPQLDAKKTEFIVDLVQLRLVKQLFLKYRGYPLESETVVKYLESSEVYQPLRLLLVYLIGEMPNGEGLLRAKHITYASRFGPRK